MAYQLNDSFQRYIIKTSKYILQDLNLSISEVAEYQQRFTFQTEELFVETKEHVIVTVTLNVSVS